MNRWKLSKLSLDFNWNKSTLFNNVSFNSLYPKATFHKCRFSPLMRVAGKLRRSRMKNWRRGTKIKFIWSKHWEKSRLKWKKISKSIRENIKNQELNASLSSLIAWWRCSKEKQDSVGKTRKEYENPLGACGKNTTKNQQSKEKTP